MAHNLNEVNGKVSFASTKTAWHGLGQIVDGAMTAKQALELAGLNFTVEKTDALAEINGKLVPLDGKFITYRKDTNEPLGVVGERYQVVQNHDAFAFFDNIIGGEAAIYETAGALGKGERIFITAKMPDYIRIAGTDDLTEVYVLLTNSHDGTGPVIAAITPIRVVCQNTLNASLRQTVNRVSIRHTTNAKSNLEQAQHLLKITHTYTQEVNEAFNALAKKSVTDAAVKKLVEDLFKSEKEDSTRIKNIQDSIFKSYHSGIGQELIRGTAWGVYNGITHYLDHEKKYKNADVRFNNILFGDSAKVQQQAFAELIKM